MDNVTHTLIGITFSRLIPSSGNKIVQAPEFAIKEKHALFWTAVLGNNLPDIDFLWAFFQKKSEGSLAYLLVHRGYTHTLVGALPMGVFAAWIACLIVRVKMSRRLLLVGVLSIFLHIGADTLNDYGVHPFSPFFNGWYYGDSVFILEPFLWVTMLPIVVSSIRWKPGRFIWFMLGLGLLCLIWFGHYTPIATAWAVTAWALIYALIERKGWGVMPVVAGLFLVLFGFSFSSHQVRSEIMDQFTKSTAARGERFQDLITTPAPGNPFCWGSWLVTQDQDFFISRQSVVSLWHRFADPENCFPIPGNYRTAPLSQSTMESDPAIHWLGDYRMRKKTFQEWREKSACFRSFLAFSRLPFLVEVQGHWVAGDLRYDRGQGKGFAQIDLEDGQRCGFSPRWDPPFLRLIAK